MAPASALTVWKSGDKLHLQFASPTRAGLTHSIELNFTQHGLTALGQILSDRERSGPSTIGHKSDPTQADANALLASLTKFHKTKAPREPAAPKLALNILNLLQKRG